MKISVVSPQFAPATCSTVYFTRAWGGTRTEYGASARRTLCPSPASFCARRARRRRLILTARARAAWARLIRKVYEADPLECPQCNGPMRIVALMEDPGVIRRILEHLRSVGAARHRAKSAARSRELAPVRQPAADLPSGSRHRLTCRMEKTLGAVGLWERACFALVFEIGCSVVNR